MKNNLGWFLLIVLAVLNFGCADKKVEPVHYDKFSLKLELEDNDQVQEIILNEDNKTVKEKTDFSPIETVPSYIKAGVLPKKMGEKRKNFLKNPNKKLKISVENIPINKFIHLVFGEVFKLNYSVSETLEKRKDKVTMRMDEKVTKTELYSVIEGILKNYKIQVENKNGVLFVSSGSQQHKQKLDYKISFGKKLQYENIPENEMIFQILPIDYIGLSKARDVLQEFALSKNEARVFTMSGNNALLIKDFASNIRRGLSLLETLDKPYLRKKTFKLIRLEHIGVDKFNARIRKVFDVLNITVASNIQGEPISLLPIEEINALFVITDKTELIDTIMYWKSKLDNIEELGDKKQLFVYHTKHRAAKEVEEILEEVMNNTVESKKPVLKDSGSILNKSKFPGKTKAKANSSTVPSETKVTLDEERNNLIFYMLPSEYKAIDKLLAAIDTRAQQILIEVTIADISLVDKLQYGLEWYLNSSSGKRPEWGIKTEGLLGLPSGGLGGFVTDTDLGALFSAFAQDNLLNILSSPKLIVLNNESASFTAGAQVPIITSQATASDVGTGTGGQPSFVQNVSYVSTGVTLSITPTITADDTIILQINQSVSEAQNNNTSSISSPIIIQRSIDTKVVLRHGEELILGGMIRENNSLTESKVPLLGDIPWLGELFKTYSETTDKTELIFVVKPYILNKVKSTDVILESFPSLVGPN